MIVLEDRSSPRGSLRTKSYVLGIESLGLGIGLESPGLGLEGDLFCFGDLIYEVTKNKKQVDSSFKYPIVLKNGMC